MPKSQLPKKSFQKLLLATIVESQLADGSFESLVSNKADFTELKPGKKNLFLSAYIGLSVGNMLPEANRKKLAHYLLGQQDEMGSYNYWERASEGMRSEPYPDDMDDTVCALLALRALDPKVLDGAQIGKLAQLLVQVEQQPGGPYATWLSNDPAWLDQDVAVNAHISLFLEKEAILLPQVETFIEEKSLAKEFSPYYVSPLVGYASLARRASMPAWVTSNQIASYVEASSSISLSLASICYAACNDTKRAKQALQQLMGLELRAEPFVIERAGKSSRAMGSLALTAALALEACGRLDQKRTPLHNQPPTSSLQEALHQEVVTRVGQIFAPQVPEIRQAAEQFLAKLVTSDPSHQLTLTPYYVAKALGCDESTRELLIEAGTATVLGWIGYTILDYFYDTQPRPALLPLATQALRELTCIYSTLLPKTPFIGYFRKIMNQIDAANQWELAHCRTQAAVITRTTLLPKWQSLENLANRSIGHALGGVCLLYALEAPEIEVTQLEEYFRHYLIARQLSDDMHDWWEDLQQGIFTVANTPLIARYLETNESLDRTNGQLYEMLSKLYWYEIIEPLCLRMQGELSLARKALLEYPRIANPQELSHELNRLETALAQTKQERQSAVDFIKQFSA